MKIYLFAHPDFLDSKSMPKFATMIATGMKERGHDINVLMPMPYFYKIPCSVKIKKWLGYIDQYVLFPLIIKLKLNNISLDSVFVFSDQALGPWVPLVKNRPHVIHVHDFLALNSSLGKFKLNEISWTGKIYQKYICRGFNEGRRFVSVSHKTKSDLEGFLQNPPLESVVVHNGLNYPFKPVSKRQAKEVFEKFNVDFPESGFFIHVGGNQWYKNRKGLLLIYKAYLEVVKNPLPLLMVGSAPPVDLVDFVKELGNPELVKFIIDAPTELVEAAYSTSTALVFPSIAEGFGWPIVEAMACGCPVITTEGAPMNEVGGDVAKYLPVMPDSDDVELWASQCADMLKIFTSLDEIEKLKNQKESLFQAEKFNRENAMNGYESSYMRALVDF